MVGKRFYKQTIHDVDVRRKTVLVRVDYNVPLRTDGTISDDSRIRASLPTLTYLLRRQCKIVLISHLGRPSGRDEHLSLEPVAARLAELLEQPVTFVNDCVGDKVRQVVRRAGAGVIVLENLRFYAEEEADDPVFAQSIARAVRPDYFVQDGFAVVHRQHASTHQIALCVPGIAGNLVKTEYMTITRAMSAPKRPFVAVIGGAKVSDKIELIHRFIQTADTIIIGGAMANTFLAYRGHAMGSSRVEPGQEATIKRIYQAAADKVGPGAVDTFLLLPTDVGVGATPEDGSRKDVLVTDVQAADQALDIGKAAAARYATVVRHARTIIWNGPLGFTENPVFSTGSATLATAIVNNTTAMSIIGGGDTADFILRWDDRAGQSFGHISTGGGASLALMAGEKLPGIESLLDAHGPGVIH